MKKFIKINQEAKLTQFRNLHYFQPVAVIKKKPVAQTDFIIINDRLMINNIHNAKTRVI